ncbi:MAG: GumC family protein [Halanaerobiales bacterium]
MENQVNNQVNNQGYNEYEEIDLKELFMTVWNNKWFITGLVVVFVLIAVIYSMFFVSPQYETSASLLILPSKYQTSLDVSTLPIETYKSLAVTQAMKASIIDDLDLINEDGTPYRPSQLDSMMSVEVQAQTEVRGEDIQAPLIVLKVKGSDPELISDVANSWADNFMEDTREIRTSEVANVVSVIQRQFNETKDTLFTYKQELKDFNQENRLDLVSEELEINKDYLSKYQDRIIDLQGQLGSEQANSQQLQELIKRQEDDSIWVGSLGKDYDTYQDNSLAAIKENYLETQNELLEFRRNHDIDLLELKIEAASSELGTLKEKLMTLRTTLSEKRIEIEKIQSLLANEPDRWLVRKAVSEDVFWQSILSDKEISNLQNLQLENEVINPIFQKLKIQLADTELRVDSIPMQIEQYEEMVADKQQELTGMHSNLNDWQQTVSRLESDITNYEEIYANKATTYQKLKARLEESQQKISFLQSQIAFYQANVKEIETETKGMQDFVWEKEITQQQLTQQVEDVQKTYDNLAEVVEEARIAEAEKTSDVKFIASSIPPNVPTGPNKKLNVAIAAVLAIFLGIFIVFIREFLKEEE